LAKNYSNNKPAAKIELTGNAYNFCIEDNKVIIENLLGESGLALEVALDEYIKSIEEFIKQG
jgi:hypothetical protein